MRRCFATFLALAVAARLAAAEIPDTDQAWTNAPAGEPSKPKPASSTPGASAKTAAKSSHAPANAQSQAQMQAALDQLTQTNHDLLDLLKKQQAVLEDIQYDRRLQSRQIQSLEDRLVEALADKRELEQKVDNLEVQASARPAAPAPTVAPSPPAPTPEIPAPGAVAATSTNTPPTPAPEPTTPRRRHAASAAGVIPAGAYGGRPTRHPIVASALHPERRGQQADRRFSCARQDVARAVA
jgi:hypothetical protein